MLPRFLHDRGKDEEFTPYAPSVLTAAEDRLPNLFLDKRLPEGAPITLGR
jgi:hypothetical protein